MTSNDCKQYIVSISVENGFNLNDKWKRIKKYKENELIIREFENNSGDIISISEDKSVKLSLHSIVKNKIISNELINTLTKEKLLTEFFKIGIDYRKEDSDYSTDKEFIEDLEDAWWTDKENGGISKNAIEEYIFNKNDSLMLADFKSIEYKLDNEIYVGNSIIKNLTYTKKSPDFINDFSPEKTGIKYDKENVSVICRQNDGMSFLVVECGGDWECPIIAFVYWSEKDNKLKGFFPINDGNVYNTITKTAYGSEDDSEFTFQSEEDYEKQMDKFELEKEKIEDNSDKIYDKAEKNGIKQFKDFLMIEESN